jgi:hypothetical protein
VSDLKVLAHELVFLIAVHLDRAGARSFRLLDVAGASRRRAQGHADSR